MTELKHTQTPWKIEEFKVDTGIKDVEFIERFIVSENTTICSMNGENMDENMCHIVKCVNEYDKLKAKADMFGDLYCMLSGQLDIYFMCGALDVEPITELLQKAKELNNENN